MANKVLLIVAFITLLLFNEKMYTKQNRANQSNAILFANPLVFKAMSATLHNLMADKLWLLSNSVSEMASGGSYNVSTEKFLASTKTIVIMDPYFYAPVNYSSTYMISIQKDIQSALDILRLARSFDARNYKLIFNELIFLLTYANDYNYKIDYNYVRALAKKTENLPIEDKQIGAMLVGNWIDDFIVMANNKLNRKAQAIEDLEWLYTQSNNAARKKEIRKRIDKLRRDKQ